MSPKTQERIVRNFAAAILNSDLSLSQMRQLADSLEERTDLVDKLQTVLLDLIQTLEGRSSLPQPSRRYPVGERERQEGLVLDLVQRQNLSKSDIVQKMLDTSSAMRVNQARLRKESTREVIERFFRIASNSEIQEFVTALRASQDRDPYLKGINRQK
jgi:hypothetical protein